MLETGTHLGPYQIVGPLGAGGMGEVYRARDSRLGREVAIKVLSERLSKDPEALARFEREVKALAAISHPNIVTIHDFGSNDSGRFAVTELLEGETLRDRLVAGALPWRKAVEIGTAIAEGLDAAHSHDVIHRDLKPGNIFLTVQGGVKILDFGLARLRRLSSPREQAAVPTLPPETAPGVVMGTMQYMSPEQARGLQADARSDIFSFGCMLYEMVTGGLPFSRDTQAETMAAIVKDEPRELIESGKRVPPELEHLILRCLAKDREQRFQSARDVATALRSLISGSAQPAISAAAESLSSKLDQVAAQADKLRKGLQRVFTGQPDLIDHLLATMYSAGHVLLEGVPGVGKTLLAKALARLLNTDFQRIQFTPDMMPSDILGTEVYQSHTQSFELRKGPVFTSILLADEVNRTPPKTQAALLQVMEERTVSIGRETHRMPPLFTVLATQNPLEFEGTYPLPEAQVDRFMTKLLIQYPSLDEDLQILEHYNRDGDLHRMASEELEAVTNPDEVLRCRRIIRQICATAQVLKYVAQIVRATRQNPHVQLGASPRGAIHLLLLSKALAAMDARDFLTPDDVKRAAPAVLRHRLILTPEAQVAAHTTDDVVRSVLAQVEVPR